MKDYILIHSGIKGQKWGIRRFQHEDGSLTPEGRERYSKMSPDRLNKKLRKEVRKHRSQNGQWPLYGSIGENSRKASETFTSNLKKVETKVQEEYAKKFGHFNFEDPNDVEKFEIIERTDPSFKRWKQELNDTGAIRIYGKPYTQKAINNLSKVNIGYLKDLGFNEESSKYLSNLLAKSKRVRID